MGKITPRLLFAVIICGLFSLSAMTALADNPYGPIKPALIHQHTTKNFFVGFLMEVAPAITDADISPASCSDASDGSLSITVTGGTAPYTYSWTGPGDVSSIDSPNISQLVPGTYAVTVSDANGDTVSDSYTVSFDDSELPVVLTKNISIALNTGGTAVIEPGDIDNGSSDNCGIAAIALNKTNFSCTDVGANQVSLKVTDINGNIATGTATVTVQDNIAPGVITQNITATLDASGNASISEDAVNNGSSDACGGLTFDTDITNFDCTDIGANTVTLTVSDTYGNSASKTAIVTIEDNVAPSVLTQNITIQLDASGNASIAEDAVNNGSSDACGGLTFDTDITNFDCTDIGANTVTFTVSDTYGNSASKTAIVTIEDNVTPSVLTQNITVQLDASGNASITPEQINNGSKDACGIQATALNVSSFNCTNIGENTVTLTVTDNHGNSASNTAVVTVEDTIKPIPPTVNNITWGCEYIVEAPIATDNCGGQIVGVPNRSTTFTGSGAIIWTFTDASNNKSSIEQKITITPLVAEIETTDINCYGFNNGLAQVTASGGVGNLIYNWGSLSGSANTKEDLAPGNYQVTVSDQNGCSIELPFTITEPQALQMTTDPLTTPVSCFGGNDGSISTGTVSGGTPPYQYSVDNTTWNATGEFNNMEAGTHTIFIVDANECALQVPVILEEPDVLNATINKTDVNCFGGSDGSISLTDLSGGSGSYQFSIDGTSWTNSSESIKGLSKGSYQVLIRDAAAQGCTIVLDDAFVINQPDAALEVSVNATRTTAYGTSTASATANPTGGTAVYTYEWRRKGSTEILYTTKSVSGLSAGDYNLTVYDRNNCKVVEEFSVYDIVNAQIVATSLCLTVDDQLRTSRFEVDLSTVVGGVGTPDNFIYNWHFGEGATPQTATGPEQTEVTYSSAGDKTITLTITDQAGVETELVFYQYVGACFESCGTTSNFIISEEGFFIGDAQGNPISGANCADISEKYLWIDIEKSSNGYSLSAEIEYTINDGTQTNARRAVDCFAEVTSYDKQGNPDEYAMIPNGLFRLFKVEPASDDDAIIEWECGQEFSVEQINIRWTNNNKRGCGENPKNMCVGLSDEVDVSTPIIASYTKEDVLCHNESTGSIFINATGGIRPYQYSLSGDNPADYVLEENRFFDLPAGIYPDVWVKDSKGNKFHLPEIEILQPDDLISEAPIPTFPTCYGETGSAIIHPSGGTPFEDGTYEYLWNDPNNQTTQEATGLSAGNYTVTVIDANGCQIIREVEITQPAQLTVANAGEDQNFNCGFNTTSLSANIPESGVGTWSIISGPTEGQIIEASNPKSTFRGSPGTYTLAWTISHPDQTCPNSDQVTVTFQEDCSDLDFDGIDDHVFLGDNYGLTTGNFSIEAWIRPKSVTNTRSIFSKRNSKDLSKGFDLIINSGAPTFRWGSKSVSTSNKVTTERWHHIAAIYNSGNISLYVDGIRVGNATAATNPAVVNAPALIGAMYNADSPGLPVNYFHGWIEEVRVWGVALSEEQLRFMMNQRLIINQSPVRGDVLPLDVPGSLNWNDDLNAYFQLKVSESGNGITPNLAANSEDGQLKNIETSQENTAPLPYISEAAGTWHNRSTWDPNSTKFWTYPNDTGINGDPIVWNIAKQNHDISSNNKDIKLLGLFSAAEKQLVMNGVNNNSGNELRITHYLELDGKIDLNGESQLVQTEGSILAEESSGIIERAQQGTANSFNYNYWTSPASPRGTSNNAPYTIKGVLKDGTTKDPLDISFGYDHTHADGNYSGNKRISTYWLYKFHGDANSYGHWRWIGHTGELKTGEGFTMKGTSGAVDIATQQNYIFLGKPHNGTITLNISNQENRLVGNPYPSAIDADQFIRDNLRDVDGGTRSQNVFNGALYFWDHFGFENSHVLREYVGGYATYTLAGGVRAASTDSRINATGDTGEKEPGRYIPVAQGFFVNSVLDDALSGNYTIDGGDITFKNSQRVFVKEASGNSQFLQPENLIKGKAKVDQAKFTADTRYKIRLNFNSPKGYHRQILVTADARTTNHFDLGYDAPLIDDNAEDMFWLVEKSEFVIQAVPDFNVDQKLPIGLKIAEEKEFSIEIGELENLPDHVDIYLLNTSDSTYHDLRKEAFKASLPAGEYMDLYEIVFHDVTSSREGKEPGQGPIDYLYSLENNEFIISNPELHKIDHINIYNIAGQLVDQHYGIPDIKEIHIPQKKSLSSGVYIVKIYTSIGDYAKKVIIRNN
jgi:hypothetical protein